MKLRKKIKLKSSTLLLIIILLIITISFFMVRNFNQRIQPKVTKIMEYQISKYSKDIIMHSFNQQLLTKYNLKDIIKITKNNQDEIIAVDFDIEKAYSISLELSENVRKSLDNSAENFDKKFKLITTYEDNSFILLIPLGTAYNSSYFANLGPKIPIKVSFAETLVSGLKTKVRDYGINNALIEVYLHVTLSEQIAIPFDNHNLKTDFDILLTSQIIEGIVPSIYNGLLENNSSLINVPLNK